MLSKEALDALFGEKMEHVLNSLQRFEANVAKSQKQLLDMLISEYVAKLQVEAGQLVDNAENVALLSDIDRVFDKFSANFQSDALYKYANDLLKITDLNADYYVGMGFKRATLDNIIKTKINLEDKLGITPTGRIKKGSYLDALAQTPEVRREVKDHVINSLTSEVSYSDYLNGFKDIIVGNEDKGINGALVRYYDQYAYDSFNQYDASSNLYMAKGLDLGHFVYEGSVIKTTRNFCRKRAGKVFTVKETKKWKNDPDLIEKKTKDSYKPLIERGRYRCRHFIRYISEELYKQMKEAERV